MRVRALTRPTNGGGGTVQLRYLMCVCPASSVGPCPVCGHSLYWQSSLERLDCIGLYTIVVCDLVCVMCHDTPLARSGLGRGPPSPPTATPHHYKAVHSTDSSMELDSRQAGGRRTDTGPRHNLNHVMRFPPLQRSHQQRCHPSPPRVHRPPSSCTYAECPQGCLPSPPR